MDTDPLEENIIIGVKVSSSFICFFSQAMSKFYYTPVLMRPSWIVTTFTPLEACHGVPGEDRETLRTLLASDVLREAVA